MSDCDGHHRFASFPGHHCTRRIHPVAPTTILIMPSIDVTLRGLRPRLLGYAALLAAAIAGACKSDSTSIAPTGTVQATITTTGASLPASYIVTVGTFPPATVPINGTQALTSILVGTYSATLSGLPANCTVTGSNPVSVTVVANTTTPASFAVVCVQTVGSVAVTTVTNGPQQPAGYTVTVGAAAPVNIGLAATVTVPNVPTGSATVTLGGVPANCTVAPASPATATVTTGATATVNFTITCVATVGTITVTTVTTGTGIPANFSYALDAGTAASIGANASASVSSVAPGSHNVTLTVPSNCTVAATNPRAVTVVAGATATAAFTVSCITTNPTGIIATSFYNGSGNWDIYTVWADGTHLTNLTPGQPQNFFSYWPRWSPDGTKIVFSRIGDANAAINAEHLMIMNANGSSPTRLTTPPTGMEDTEPDWSPNGAKIAFARMVGGTGPTGQPTVNYDIYSINTDGSGLLRLTNSVSDNGHPRWSPDGTKILFESYRGGDYNIWVMNADGSNVTQISTLSGDDGYPDWSPSGTKITWVHAGLLIVANADGSGQQLSGSGLEPVFSPTLTKILFTDATPSALSASGSHLYLSNYDGSGKVALLTEPGQYQTLIDPAWSSHGGNSSFIGSASPSVQFTPPAGNIPPPLVRRHGRLLPH